MAYPTVSDNPHVQAFYVQMRLDGQNHAFAEMCALRQPPGAMADGEFFRDQGTLADQFKGDEAKLEHITAVAKSQGYTPTPNDVYMPGLADYPGDPLAFVPPTGGRHHIKKVCEEKNLECSGQVNVKRVEKEPSRNVPLAEDLVQEAVADMHVTDPDLCRKATYQDLREEAIYRHGPQKADTRSNSTEVL